MLVISGKQRLILLCCQVVADFVSKTAKTTHSVTHDSRTLLPESDGYEYIIEVYLISAGFVRLMDITTYWLWSHVMAKKTIDPKKEVTARWTAKVSVRCRLLLQHHKSTCSST